MKLKKVVMVNKMEINILGLLSMVFLTLIAFSFFNEKVLKLPTEIGLMTIAFIMSVTFLFLNKIGLIPFDGLADIFNALEFHEVVMNGFLCFLLFSGSAKIKFDDLTHDKYLISTLAFFSTLLSTLLYAGMTYGISNLLGINLTFLQSCILGSIIAPTDPISAMSILKKAGLPDRISLIMEGESLFNDGIAVALFVTFTSLNINSSSHPFRQFFETIAYDIVGAVAIALVVSIILFQVFKHTKQKYLEILISLAAVTLSYSLSEWIHVSAPTAAVVVGIFFATKMNHLHHDSESYYINFYVFWKVIDKILNGILYILIGFAVLFIEDSNGFILIICSAILFALVARFISILLPIWFFSRDKRMTPQIYSKEKRRRDQFAMSKLLTWGGLKGGICIALALGTVNTFEPTQYNYIVLSTYAVVAFSTLVQGLTIKKVYGRLKKNLC